ncbi:MAG: response regulator [Treponema sp.]|jgi:signal transduction histidine kinase/FixJ family two-component response regulator/HPt (histidine-containing phosphotransfer) domain-containing protein|nr:response regulator [Treponema sp.]
MDNDSETRIKELEDKNRQLEREYRSLARQHEIAKITIERSKMYISSKDKLLAAVINEKARQEEYFNLLIENTQEIMLILDHELRFIYCSKMFLRQAGISGFESISDREFRDVFSRITDQGSLEHLTDLLLISMKERRPYVETQVLDIGMKGNPRHYTILLIPMINKEGYIQGMLVLFQDMTDVITAKEQAEEANRAKSSFLARMSHEIRTPLNAILGLSEVELGNNLSESTRINLEKIYTSGFLLLEIVNDILDISKIGSGNFEILPVSYEFPNLINDTVQLNIVRIGSKPIEFKLEIDESIPSRFYGDEIRVKQILNNLLSNAFKYTDKGEVWLVVAWERQEDNAWLTFTVSDTGRGIKKEDQEKLFAEYTQFETGANRKIEGTGLGLSITRGLVEKMAGTISVESKYLKGSMFRVTLPQGILDEKPIGKEVVNNLRSFRFIEDRSRSRGNNIIRSYMPYGKVLVVDDLETNLDVMTGLLMPYGLKVDTVLSGREAVEAIRKKEVRYDLVFMDHMMPEMDGTEATRFIRNEIGTEYARTVPIVALTANAVSGSREMFLESGFNDFISKPVDIKRLDMALNQWVRDKQSEATLKEVETRAVERMAAPESGAAIVSPENDDPGNWLLKHPVEGIDFAAALRLYGNSGAAYIPILKSFITHTPLLLEKLAKNLEASPEDYLIEIHGLKGTCNAIGAVETGALARKLEFGMKEGNIEMVKARHGELEEKVRKLMEGSKQILAEWEVNRPEREKEGRAEPDKELLKRLSEITAAFNSNETEEVLRKLEQYRYEKGEDLIRWLREQAENFDYDAMHRKLEEFLKKQ